MYMAVKVAFDKAVSVERRGSGVRNCESSQCAHANQIAYLVRLERISITWLGVHTHG